MLRIVLWVHVELRGFEGQGTQEGDRQVEMGGDGFTITSTFWFIDCMHVLGAQEKGFLFLTVYNPSGESKGMCEGSLMFSM